MPSKLGKYEVREPVGNGASGTVYDAWDPDLARRVAIKQVQLHGRPDTEQRELRARFRQEAQIAGRLSHPGVVSVFDYGEQDGAAYLVMEFVDGESLAAVLQGMRQRHETMPPERAAAIVGAMLQALAACHRAGVLHRDIKPGNVMLSRDGVVKLTDFGIARTEVSDLTAQGTLLGTPTYMSPEQFEARGAVDARSDLYGCGVVLYELLTGRKPFEGDLFAVMHQVRTEQPVPPSRVSPAVSPALDAVVLRAMAKQPADRFPDAAAFAEALARSILAASPRSSWRRVAAVTAGVLGLVAIGGAAWYLIPVTPASVIRPSPAPVATASPLPPAPAAAGASEPSQPDLDARLLPTLDGLPCAAIEASLQRSPALLRLRGLVGTETARDALAPLLAGYRGMLERDGLQAFPESGALCQAAELVHGGEPSGLRLTVAGNRTALTEGEAIRVTLQMPAFAGDVRLDYITDGGQTVVHLDPAEPGMHRWAAAEQVALGPAGDGVIGTVGEPYGVDMLLVSVAEQPLLPETRAPQEPAEAYLHALRTAMSEHARRGGRVTAAAVVLQTSAH